MPILRCENPLPEPPPASRILVIRLGAVGDVVRTLPAVSALRRHYADAHLCWLVEPSARSVLDGAPWLDEIRVFPRTELGEAARRLRLGRFSSRLSAFLRELRNPGFDLVIDFHSILKSGVLGRLSGAPMRVAYGRPFGREFGHLFATHRARLSPPLASRFERNEALVRFLAIDPRCMDRPLSVSEADAALVAKQLAEEVPDFDAEQRVCLNPGTSRGAPHKRYTVEGYAEIARRLRAAGYGAVVTWGPDPEERAFAQAIVDRAGEAAAMAPATPSLMALAALLSNCRLYVGSDTGPMHIASLVGTPVVQLMGPTDPIENTPYPHTPWRRARIQIACNPCRRGCAAAPCMSLIPPDVAVDEALSLLS